MMHTTKKWLTGPGLWQFECKQGDYEQGEPVKLAEAKRRFREHRKTVGEAPYEGVNLTTTVSAADAAELDKALALRGLSRSAFLRDAVRAFLWGVDA